VKKTVALSMGLVVSLGSATAGAFCRTTTCDPKIETCTKDPETGCILQGKNLFWRERCVSFGTQEDGSPRRGISYETADHIFQEAFSAWMLADCGGGAHPSIQMWDFGPIVCNEPEFNDFLPNANVWMFRDKDWPYNDDSQTLALTTVLFERGSGAILDADVEVNSFAMKLSVTDTHVERDLQSIATHEAGHFLGLSHTKVTGATMQPQYTAGDLNYRTIHDDDQAGICNIYPPDRQTLTCTQPHPPHGFSKYCGGGDHAPAPPGGCAVAAETKRPGESPLRPLALISALALVSRVVRRRGSSKQ
jgi:hypothetical protein